MADNNIPGRQTVADKLGRNPLGHSRKLHLFGDEAPAGIFQLSHGHDPLGKLDLCHKKTGQNLHAMHYSRGVVA
jgi:hypothetical protein